MGLSPKLEALFTIHGPIQHIYYHSKTHKATTKYRNHLPAITRFLTRLQVSYLTPITSPSNSKAYVDKIHNTAKPKLIRFNFWLVLGHRHR